MLMLLFDEPLTEVSKKLLNELDMPELGQKIAITWNKRMRSTAGRAFWPDWRIELNPKLKSIAPEQIERTLRHELAHLVAFARYKGKKIAPHGAEWQQACIDLEIPGELATHTLPLPSKTIPKKWRYTCPACGEGFNRARKMKRYAGCYRCCKIHNGGYYHKKFRLVESYIG